MNHSYNRLAKLLEERNNKEWLSKPENIRNADEWEKYYHHMFADEVPLNWYTEDIRRRPYSLVQRGYYIDSETDLALNDLLKKEYSNLIPQELCILRWILYTCWDLESEVVPYEEIVLRVLPDRLDLFENEKEVEKTIRELINKNIIKCKDFVIQNNTDKDRDRKTTELSSKCIGLISEDIMKTAAEAYR
jgi:hypothetical protein